jgi:hypothetical protein
VADPTYIQRLLHALESSKGSTVFVYEGRHIDTVLKSILATHHRANIVAWLSLSPANDFVSRVTGERPMTTLTYDTDFPSAAIAKDGAAASVSGEATDKPGLFARIMDALARTYYIGTPDGKGYYVQPSF